MDHYAHLWLFFLMVLGIIVLPGMDMAFVMASSLTGSVVLAASAATQIC